MGWNIGVFWGDGKRWKPYFVKIFEIFGKIFDLLKFKNVKIDNFSLKFDFDESV